jgi:indolepyruvate ferredoxin oxidoreductase beta subunit
MDKSKPMNIAIIGLGGQGIVTLSKLITETYYRMGKKVIMYEVHGYSQRSGSVSTFLRINEDANPLFAYDDTDFIIGLDTLETLRYLYLARGSKPTILITNKYQIRNTKTLGIEVFPNSEDIMSEIEKKSEKIYLFDALSFEKSFRAQFKPLNVAIFSAFTSIPYFEVEEAIAKKVVSDLLGKYAMLKRINTRAFKEGKSWILT